jgi:hypothetical protein
LNRQLYEFAQDVRSALLRSIEVYALLRPSEENDKVVQLWAMTLGPLIWDVSGSVLLLLSHDERRAPVILNRSVFEYQLRLRYYSLKPDKAAEAIKQMPERFRKIMRVDPTWRLERSAANIVETEAFLGERDDIARENIKGDLFKTVFGADAAAYYDAYYGKASGLVHGYETVIRDVHRERYNRIENPTIDLAGTVWSPDDAVGVLIYTLLDALAFMIRLSGAGLAIHEEFEARFATLESQLEGRVSEVS